MLEKYFLFSFRIKNANDDASSLIGLLDYEKKIHPSKVKMHFYTDGSVLSMPGPDLRFVSFERPEGRPKIHVSVQGWARPGPDSSKTNPSPTHHYIFTWMR